MKKIVFIFPGQGSQYPGMGKELAAFSAGAGAVFEEADDLLGFALRDLIFNGDERQLRRTEVTQPAILTVSLAILAVLRENGITPGGVAGLSLGEYSALVCANSLSFAEALPLVQKRAVYMQEAVPLGRGGMAAVLGLSADDVTSVCRAALPFGIVEPVNYNCPGQIVIAGHIEALEEACRLVKEQKGKTVKLSVSAPFHSSLLRSAEGKMSALINSINPRRPEISFIANTDADYLTDPEAIKASLIRQVYSPVLWEDTIRRFISDGYNTFIEVGPGRSLTGFLKKIDKEVAALHVENEETLKKVINHLEVVSL